MSVYGSVNSRVPWGSVGATSVIQAGGVLSWTANGAV